MKSSSILCFLFLAITILQANPSLLSYQLPLARNQDSSSHPYLDTLMRSFLEKTQIAGVSVTIMEGREVQYAQGFGYADVENQLPMKPTTRIRTASVAKVLTATALGKLATEGKLDFDTPLKSYIPYIQLPYASLTTRQIAGHTAGVQHRPSTKKAKNKHYTEVRETVNFMMGDPLLFEPGTDYQYSTQGYNLLAALIEEVSGKRFVDYMRENIFQPLQMTQTFPDHPSDYTAEDARMYYLKNGTLRLDKKIYDGSYKLAGAGFRSTSSDLAHMMQAYFNGFLSEKVIAQMCTSSVLQNGDSTQVGIGWRLNRDGRDRLTIEHAGSWQGARTVIVYYPDYQLTVAMMINTQCQVFIEETAHLLADAFWAHQAAEKIQLAGWESELTIRNDRLDGSIETYEGILKFKNTHIGKLKIETDKAWL
ncbi:MAG: serine hydrolase domain-containing protein, partial [Bacteroidota bacterium]